MTQETKNMSFLDHLSELRWHLIRMVISILLFSLVAFFCKEIIFDQILFAPKKADFITYELLCKSSRFLRLNVACVDELPFIIQNRSMSGQFSSHIWASLISGFILAFPYIVWEFWRFLAPGLTKKEKKYSKGMVFSSGILFSLGVGFGYFLIVPLSLQFLANYTVSSSILNEIDLSSYVTTIFTIIIASGLMFQLPILIYFLTKIGLITPQIMKKYRKHAMVGVLILSAIITPPDVSSQILVSIPIIFLYQMSILISKTVIKKQKVV